jgi:hypothetical protein
MKTPKLPRTDSIKELAKFWEGHDFVDFEDQMERVEEPIFDTATSVVVHLKPREAQKLKNLARSKGVEDSEMIRQWIRERIHAA